MPVLYIRVTQLYPAHNNVVVRLARAANVTDIAWDFSYYTELSLILQEYMYEIGACLLQLDIADDADASTRLHKLTSEAMNLIATRTRLDRNVLNAVMHQDVLSLSSVGNDPFAHKLDGDFYTQILVSAVLCLVLCCAVLHFVVLHCYLLLGKAGNCRTDSATRGAQICAPCDLCRVSKL